MKYFKEPYEESSFVLESCNKISEVISPENILIASSLSQVERPQRDWQEKSNLKSQNNDSEHNKPLSALLQDNVNRFIGAKRFTGYTELQKATGLRVLRKVLDRQQSLEQHDENILTNLKLSIPFSQNESFFSKKPPPRLKPLQQDSDQE